MPRAECRERVRATLAMVGLAGYEDRYPRRMSGGQQQRVALARALVIRPSVLLLDEPLSNLDAKLREDMQIELRQIQRTLGTTTILVTHDQIEAMSLSDRIVVMNQGRIEQIGTPQQTYERPASAFVSQFLGKTNDFAATIDRTAPGAAGRRLLERAGTGRRRGTVTVSIRPERIGFADTGSSGQDRHPDLPGQSLAVPVRDRMRACDRDPSERWQAAARRRRGRSPRPGGRRT